jgi:hypothetical protein
MLSDTKAQAAMLVLGCLLVPAAASAQARSTAAQATTTEAAEVICPSPLGEGAKTGRFFCDVLAGRDPEAGIIVKLPPRRGTATLSFELHNRHTYSEEQARAGRAYASYTATIGVLSLDNTLLTRAVVQNEFRRQEDLFDLVAGGAGPSGLKAVAPTGSELIIVDIPADLDAVSILGETLTVVRMDGTETFTTFGRPLAAISNVMVEYRPAPPKKAPTPVRKK